ncbi:MAG TPA: hypothetical protein PLZ36_17165 [Armatimonadota bacterium]|nr:hypothetical protein [Armatimonadota bacterium]
MADIGEPYQFDCPLCGHPQRMAARGEEMCRYCGAELAVMSDQRVAHRLAEELKRRGENAVWIAVPGRGQWVVAHKATPVQRPR